MAQYDHDEGFAIGGGYVYRGAGIPELRGRYVFTDLPRRRLFAIDADGLGSGDMATIEELRITFDDVERALADEAGFPNTYSLGPRVDARRGIDHDGELYLLTKGDGWLRKLVSNALEQVDASARVDDFVSFWLTKRRWQICEDGSLAALGEDCG